MVAVVKIKNIKGLKKELLGNFDGLTAGVKKRKYSNSKWTTVDVAQYAEDTDKVFSKPFAKITKKNKEIIASSIEQLNKKGKITKKNQKALNNIVVNPILARKYGKNKPSTLEYKTGNVKWLNTGKFINSIEVLLKIKKNKKK